eukprot:13369066-Ditylum_brightwellii.AAC.1
MHYGCIIHLTHCAGTRMIEQGTDGLSWGSTDEGVMVGGDMPLYVPLNLTATECYLPLQNWITEWALN